jgi:hypothetical protein
MLSVLTVGSCLAYPSTLKMEAICLSEASVDFQRTEWRYIPEESILHNHRCENLKSYRFFFPEIKDDVGFQLLIRRC